MDKQVEQIEAKINQLKPKLAQGGVARDQARSQIGQLLRQRKQLETQLSSMRNQSLNLMSMASVTTSIKANVETVKVMAQTAKEMRREFKKLTPEKVQDLADDMQELMIDAQEIGDVLSQAYDVPGGVDETCLDDELDLIEADLGTEMVAPGDTPVYLEASGEGMAL